MSKHEEKFQHYKEKMIAALIRLMETRPFPTVSVTELCREAGVQRSTFYAHYHNTMELLIDAGRQVIEDFQSYWQEKSLEEMTFPYLNEQNLMLLLTYVETHRSVVTAFLREDSPALKNQIVDWIAEHMTYPYTKNIGDRVFADYIVRFYLASIREIVARWLERDCAEDKDEICRIILTCLDRTRLVERMMEIEAEACGVPEQNP